MNLLRSISRAKGMAPGPTMVRVQSGKTTGGSWLRAIGACIERRRQRRVLASLDDRLLADIGITRIDAAQEAAKPFWR